MAVELPAPSQLTLTIGAVIVGQAGWIGGYRNFIRGTVPEVHCMRVGATGDSNQANAVKPLKTGQQWNKHLNKLRSAVQVGNVEAMHDLALSLQEGNQDRN
jgi:hypothetical protein